MATYISEDGREIKLSPPTYFIHKELQNLCGDPIDVIDMGENGVLVINTDAYQIGIPKNEKATALALPYILEATYIAGPAIHATLAEISNPITVAKLKQLHEQRSMV
jgi:hypothetical protein